MTPVIHAPSTPEKYAVLLQQMHRDAEAQPLAARARVIRAQPVQARRASTP